MIKTHFISFIIFCCIQFTTAQEAALIPYPNQISMATGELTYQEAIPFSIPSDLALAPTTIISQAESYHIKLINQEKGGAIRFKRIKKLADEAYQLTIDKKGITIGYGNRAGAFYALQTLNQLIHNNGKTYTIPYATITDQPTFHWRAYILGESGCFQGVRTVKTHLDEMARLKMNTLQWHLVDNLGWRIEIGKYPKLTSIGPKEYYTKNEIRDIIAYAEARCITIVPEIEISGHASTAIRAYPELGTLSKISKTDVRTDIYDITDPKVEQFLQDVLTEVIDLFPSHVIHVGGNEVPHKLWENTPSIADFMITNQLPKAKDLQFWFLCRISKFLQSKGCDMMGWNEITGDNILGETIKNQSEKLDDGTVIQFWNGDVDLIKKSIERGHKIVNSNHFSDNNEPPYGNASIEKSYSFSPISKGLNKKDKKNIWGLSCRKVDLQGII